MSDADWQELSLETRSESVDALEAWLFSAGALAVTLEDAADQPLLEPGPGETPVWDCIRLSALFPAGLDLAPITASVPLELLSRDQRDVRQFADRDWERAWMEQFKPMQMGDRLWVCPSWREPPAPDAVNLILDPGLAFGSGTHPTTALCLSALDSLVSAGDRVVDYGCGSGVLAIAAMKLGAQCALGFDNDPQALVASRDNGERNGIAATEFRVCMPDAAGEGQWQGEANIVVANILANPLIDLAPVIAGFLAPGATLLLAGLLEEQAGDVAEAYAPWLALTVRDQRDGWALLAGSSPERATP